MLLTFTPASSAEEQLDIYIKFPDFYGINVTATSCCKTIGLVGFNYTGYVIVGAPNKEVNLTNKTLEIKCSPRDTENLEPDSTLYSYNDLACVRIHDTISLSEKLNATLLGAGESKSFPINVFFHETGFHELRWKEKEESKWWIKSISIIEPIEYEKLTKQAEVLETEKRSAEASENAANTTKWLAGGTFALVIATFALGIITYFVTSKSIKESRIVKAKELHTYEIRKFAESWMRNLTEIKIGTPDTPDTSPPQPQKYDFEEKRLFLDIKNHTPQDLDILGTWKKFKKLLHEYDKKRYELFKDICKMSVERTGLEYDPNLSLKTNGISEFFVRSIYGQLVTWVQKQEMKYDSYTYFPKNEGGGIVVGHEELIGFSLFKVSNPELAKKTWGIYEEMMKMNDFDQCSEKIKEILVIEKDLKQYFQDLNSMLNDFSSIPILPGTCKFIKWSVE
jgi:hypothetical protein